METCQLLLQAGADILKPDDNGNGPIFNVTKKRSPEMLELLLRNFFESQRVISPALETQISRILQHIRTEMPAIYAEHTSLRHNMKLLSVIYSRSGMVPLAGELRDYEVAKEDGLSCTGGFGDCYKGNLWGIYPVALKCLRVQSEKDDSKKYFLREVDVWARLRHLRILPLIGMCTLPSGRTYMISPWMRHGNILSYLESNQDVDRLLLLTQVGEGLEYLHMNSVIHGDIRGPNVLISESGDACLADFGLSKLEEQTQSSYSSAFHRAGNPRWMAPELLLDEVSVRTTTTDVFSFGRLIIEILTGEHPFPEVKGHRVTLVASQRALPDRPMGIAVTRGLDDNMWDLVKDCCNIKPDLRPKMGVVLSRLRAAHTAHNSLSRAGL